MRAVLLVVVVGCGDAAPPIDARSIVMPPNCGDPYPDSASCVAGLARSDQFYFWPIPQHCPNGGVIEMKVSCALGCSVEGELKLNDASAEAHVLAGAPGVLCAEAPTAKAGDACTWSGAPCMPTRSALNADGTVAGRDDFNCNGTTCVAAPQKPLWSSGLQACPAATIATYGTNGVVGYVVSQSCLLAWDEATQTVASAQTRTCIGDWQCPRDALCDDQIPLLPATGTKRFAVCKPGPRGMLTPAMLAP